MSKRLAAFCVWLLFAAATAAAPAQQSVVLVIEGGTLIDGNGGAPVRDALINRSFGGESTIIV